MASMKVGTRLLLGFGTTIILTAIVGLIGFTATQRLSTATSSMDKNGVQALQSLAEVENALWELRFGISQYLAVPNPESRRKIIADSPRLFESLDHGLKQFGASELTPEAQEAFIALKDIYAQYKDKRPGWFELMEAGKIDEAAEYRSRTILASGAGTVKALRTLVDIQTQAIADIEKAAKTLVVSTAIGIAVVTLISLVVAVLIGLWISRNLMKQLGGEPDYAAAAVGKISAGDLSMDLELRVGDNGSLLYSLKVMQDNLRSIISNDVGRVLEAMSRGDLNEKISKDYPGVFGQLRDDANTTVEKLTDIIAQVKNSTDLITTASQEIAQGNADLSQRTEEQASSLEETASSMEELTSTVKQNAENAKHANQLSMNASDIAVKGGEVVGDVVDTMASISASSKKIVDIISVIEGIAFQTNILALNAAVEAARAGEQGRGFAVVASEVRSLAQRSAAAAKEIKNLIDDSVGKVDTGSRQVDQAGETMNEIVTAVKRVTDIMAEISAASNEQSAGIEQVNLAMVQMDTVTQQNAALVEEAAAAAASMQEQASALDMLVSTFRLDEGRGGVTVSKPFVQPHKAVAASSKERKLLKTRPENKDEDWKVF
jgi:methyl-accepting chemotaxis protein